MIINLKKLLKREDKLYFLLSVLIVILAAFLRFYRLSDRWQIHYDGARDAIIGSQALKLGKIPLNGPFASAGPFVFGPIFYHLIILSYLVFPKVIIAPQIMMAAMNTLYVYVMLKVGELHSKKLAVILGFLAALSPLHMKRSSDLTQHNLIALFTALTLFAFISYIKHKNILYLLLLGFFIGCGLSLHYQALNLFVFLPFAVFAFRDKLIKVIQKIIVLAIGILLPLSPLIVWDWQRGWKNINNIMDYFLIGQYRIWVSNRWLIYIGKFWPQFWAEITGIPVNISFIFMVGAAILVLYKLLSRKKNKTILYLGLIFGVQLILNRYYRGEKLTMYLHYFQPLVIYFTGFLIYLLFKLKNNISFVLFISFLIYLLISDYRIIQNQKTQIVPINHFVSYLKLLYPQQQFKPYVFNNNNPAAGAMSSLIMSFSNLINENNGLALGFSSAALNKTLIYHFKDLDPPIYIYNLSQEKYTDLTANNWFDYSPSAIYSDIVEWWKVKEFKSTFCLPCFVKEKLGLKKF